MKELTKEQIISVMEMLLLDGASRSDYSIVTVEEQMAVGDLFVTDNLATKEVVLQPGKYLTVYACDYDFEEYPHLTKYLMRGEVEFKALDTNLSIVILLCLESR